MTAKREGRDNGRSVCRTSRHLWLICSGRDSVLLAVCTAAPMAARTAGWLARTAGAGSVMACWVAKRAAVSGSSAISAAM
jgi:hypothetical protein